MNQLMRIVTAATVTAAAGFGVLAGAAEPSDVRQSYRFVLKADGGGKASVQGLITVDGKDRLIERGETPLEFSCEAGSIIAGYFEPLEAGATLRLTVIDPEHSKRRPALTVQRFERIRFSWAQAGVGPRCADQGQGACPETTPSVSELKKRLASLLEAH